MPVDLPSNSCSFRNNSSPWMGKKCCGFTILSTSSFKNELHIYIVLIKKKMRMEIARQSISAKNNQELGHANFFPGGEVEVYKPLRINLFH